MTLCTIGYGGVPWASFIAALHEANVQVVVDVRHLPHSKSAPHYSRAALATTLPEEALEYQHAALLGNPHVEQCKALKSLDPYRAHLEAHRDALLPLLAMLDRGQRVALLCGCPIAGQCHRSVIAKAVQALRPELEVQHLRPAQGQDRGPAPKILGLTLIQPWAWAIAHAGKRVENRTWKPWCPIGTYLAIHAGAKMDQGMAQQLRADGIAVPSTVATGAIVAVAQLEGVATHINAVPDDQVDRWWCGPVGWLLDNVVPIEPVPCKGKQGLWRLEPVVLEAVRERWKAARR